MDAINPDYYKSNGLEAIGVIEAFFMHSPHLATAFKYLARMGEKPGNSLEQDAEKAKWYIDRWVKFQKAKDHGCGSAAFSGMQADREVDRKLAQKLREKYNLPPSKRWNDLENTDWNGDSE